MFEKPLLVGLAGAGVVSLALGGVAWVQTARLHKAEATIVEKRLALGRAAAALKVAAAEISSRDDALKTNGKGEAIDATQTATFWKGQARAAFDAGYASRRCDGAAVADGVRDLKALWSAGAYSGSAAGVPGQPGR